MGKAIYWLMLLVDTYRIRYGYGYALPGTYRTASDVVARDGFRWPFGLFGNHDRDHYKGTYGAYAYERKLHFYLRNVCIGERNIGSEEDWPSSQIVRLT